MALSLVVLSYSDGSIWCWSLINRCNLFNVKYHDSDVNCTDFNNEVIASGSKDGKILLWPFQVEGRAMLPNKSLSLDDRVLSLKLSSNKLLAVGTSGFGLCPLSVYDTNT